MSAGFPWRWLGVVAAIAAGPAAANAAPSPPARAAVLVCPVAASPQAAVAASFGVSVRADAAAVSPAPADGRPETAAVSLAPRAAEIAATVLAPGGVRPAPLRPERERTGTNNGESAALCALGLLAGASCGLADPRGSRDPQPPVIASVQVRSLPPGLRSRRFAHATACGPIAVGGAACDGHARGVFRPPRGRAA